MGVGRAWVWTRPLSPHTCRRSPVWSAARSTDDRWHTSSSTRRSRQSAGESVRASSERERGSKCAKRAMTGDKKRKCQSRLWFSHSRSLQTLHNTRDFTRRPPLPELWVTTSPPPNFCPEKTFHEEVEGGYVIRQNLPSVSANNSITASARAHTVKFTLSSCRVSDD